MSIATCAIAVSRIIYSNHKKSIMKKIVTTLALVCAALTMHAQTTATDWTAADCNSTSHTLFNELDNGKIIVLVWVMPCGMCNSGAKQAYDAAQSFASTNPGQVLYYLVDDQGATCASLSSFATSNTIGPNNLTTFSNTGNVIDEADFGGSGMPHVVVMGGANHQIYFNKVNGQAADQPGITAAINTAIGALSVENVANEIAFTVSPNPAVTSIVIENSTPVAVVTITSLNGQVVKNHSFSNGKMNPVINLSDMATGVYMVKITDAAGKTGMQKLIKN
jgi:hypothetical protein